MELERLTTITGGHMELDIIGIDLAKEVFHISGVDRSGREVLKKKVYRSEFAQFLHLSPKSRVVMESCGGSNHWARIAEQAGHKVQLIAPQHVTPFVQRNKNDFKDAAAICEAASRPQMKFVPRRSIEQQDIQNLHRIRSRLVKGRTALINELRGLLLEYGIVMSKSRRAFEKQFMETLEAKGKELTSLARETFSDLWNEYWEVDARVEKIEKKLEAIFKAHPVCKQLGTIPGVGVLTATAVVSAVGDISVFKNGRQLAAWLGLTPREYSTGGKQRLLGISKKGDCYIRMLLVHGARSTLYRLKNKEDKRSMWAKDLLQRKGTNRTAVALANKNARTIWALLTHRTEYQTFQLAA